MRYVLDRVIIVFFVIVSMMTFFAFKLLESDAFAVFAVKHINRKFKNELYESISFKNIDVAPVISSAIINQVSLKLRDGTTVIAEKVSLSFSLEMLFSRKVIISEIGVKHGAINSKMVIQSSGNQTINFKDSFETASRSLSDGIVVALNNQSDFEWRSISLGDMKFTHEKANMIIDLLEINKYKKMISLEFKIADFIYASMADDIYADEIYGIIDLTKDFINIKSIEIKRELSMFKASVVHHWHSKRIPEVQIKVVAPNYELSRLNFLKGDISSQGSFEAQAEILNGKMDVRLSAEMLFYKNVNIEEIQLEMSEDGNDYLVSKLNSKLDGGTLSLAAPFKVFELGKSNLNNLALNARNIELKNLLPFVGIDKVSIGGRFSGNAELKIGDRLPKISIAKSQIVDFSLNIPGKRIIHSKIVEVNSLILDFASEKIAYDLNVNGHPIIGGGVLSTKNLKIQGEVSTIDLNSIESIAGVPFGGILNVRHSLYQNENNDLILDIEGKFNNFSVLSFFLGNGVADISINISKGNLLIRKFEAVVKGSAYSGDGLINFSKPREGLNLRIGSNRMEIEGLFKILPGILGRLPISSNKISGPLAIDVVITGGFDIESLFIGAKASSLENVFVYGERFDKFTSNMVLKNLVLEIVLDRMEKGGGLINGKYIYNIDTQYHDFYFELSEILLDHIKNYSDLGFGLRGVIDGTVHGNGGAELFSSRMQLKVHNSSIRDKKFPDTFVSMFLTNEEIMCDFNIADGIARGSLKYPLVEKKPFGIDLKVDAKDVKDILGFFRPQVMDKPDFTGEVAFSLTAGGPNFSIEDLNANFFFDKLNLKYKNSKLFLQPNGNTIRIEDGDIKEWNILMNDETGNQLYSRARGRYGSDYKIEAGFDAPFDLIEILIPEVSDLRGRCAGRIYLNHHLERTKLYAEYSGKDVALSSYYLPGEFNNINFVITQNDYTFNIQHFSGNYQKGPIAIYGKADLSRIIPNVDVQLTANDITIPLNKESSVSLDLKSRFKGTNFPYSLKTDLFINRGRIYDEFYTFKIAKYKKGSAETPFSNLKHQKTEKKLIIKNNLVILNPFHIRNSLLDIKVTGAMGHLRDGNENFLSGRLEVLPGQGKIKFKGYDFTIKEGFLEGAPSVEMGYNLSLAGEAKINDYLVTLEVLGNEKNVSVNFRSQPPLPQEDLLSLLTLGVPLNVSKNLRSSDLRSVTGVGVGNILFDQFGLNEGLDKSLGVKLSVSPDFDDDISPIRGRSSGQEQVVSRTKSNTKIRIDKRINKQVDFSFTGTVGGSADSRQEMNLNYRLDRNFSLQGIYEIKNDDTTEGSANTNSMGLDLIWKRSF